MNSEYVQVLKQTQMENMVLSCLLQKSKSYLKIFAPSTGNICT